MKFALIIIVTLGLIALSQPAPVEETPMIEGENADEAKMNEVADPNCGPKGGSGGGAGAGGSEGEDQETQQMQEGNGRRQGRGSGKRKGGGGRGRGRKQNQEE